MSLEIEGKNWCRKYDHEIDYELVHQICETPHPKGCANCEFNDYRISITNPSDSTIKPIIRFSGLAWKRSRR